MQVRMEKELAPLLACVEEVKKKVASEKRVPSYGTLKEWAQARADMAVAAARGAKRGNGVLQPAQVEVDLSGRKSTQYTLTHTPSFLLRKSFARKVSTHVATGEPLPSASIMVKEFCTARKIYA